MSIVIFGDVFTFPEGFAATNRVYLYAKGFIENGIEACVICFSNEYLDISDDLIDEIPYYHPFQQKERSNYFLIRRWQNLMKYFKTYALLKKLNKQEKISVINSWTNLFLTHLFAWFLSKVFRAKLIAECSEHPLRFYQRGFFRKKIGAMKVYIESRLNDGFFCISRYLVNFYQMKGVNKKKLFLVPSITDPSRFLNDRETPFPYPYIGYFGSLTSERDSIDLLIKAFSKVNCSKPHIYLVLGGFCTDIQKKKIIDLVKKLNIETKVKILDRLSKEEITRYIANACVLVMVRSKDLESAASYPSKLTEFLSTGRPVISVNVGEISDYLLDGVNAFLTEAGNSNGIADKLIYIFDNYTIAERIAEQGRALTAGVFNYNYQAKRMIDFVGSLTDI
jgi:glycosyltransferase involved in cell wall biosynthesis